MSTKDYLEKDYYKVLGVSKDAESAEIKKAYRKLAREYHPDTNRGDARAEERFKEISEAYDVLADEKRRKEYDEARTLFAGGGVRGPGAGGGFNIDFGDLFGGTTTAPSGGLGDILGGLFNRGGTRTTGARRGTDIESEVTLDFVDAIEGATVPIRMTSERPCRACGGTGAKPGTFPRVCPTCSGTGQTSRNQGGFALSDPCRDCKGSGMLIDDPCDVCHGSGRAASSTTMQVRIPSGVQDGQRIRLKGKGGPGERGGPAGDLYVQVHIRPHRVFGRKGDNLTVTVPVTFAVVALGAAFEVPTITGSKVKLRVAPGTANGRTLRVRGRGARRSDGTRGDLLVTVEVTVPTVLSTDAQAALEKFRDATAGEDPRRKLLADLTGG